MSFRGKRRAPDVEAVIAAAKAVCDEVADHDRELAESLAADLAERRASDLQRRTSALDAALSAGASLRELAGVLGVKSPETVRKMREAGR